MERTYDLAIIGGGINGCGCAADAAMRGLSVLLCEQDDIASKTSSSSSKLIHGGLRYLEYYDFALVKKALDEQQILLNVAAHLVHPLPFVLPHTKKARPNWLLRAGLFLYDHLSRTNTLPNHRYIQRNKQAQYFTPLAAHINDGFIYYDCTTDDARLTLANAIQAKKNNATILTQTALVAATTIDNQWQLTLQPQSSTPFQIKAKAIINATGPWAELTNQLLKIPMHHPLSHVKGSHIVVPKQYEGEHAYVLQHDDQRIVFVMPYHGKTLIGTTEVLFTKALNDVQIEPSEINYLCALTQRYFKRKLTSQDILYTWSGIRPLLSAQNKKPTALSRDYAFHFSTQPAPAITIYGGKITTYRKLALNVVNQLQIVFPELPASNTETTPLPGATLGQMNFSAYQTFARNKYAWLDSKTLNRYLDTYGTLTEVILKDCNKPPDLGRCFMPTLYQVEIDYLRCEEWANTVDDILWRRTKLGLSMDANNYQALNDYMTLN
ncbi:glycerol-3-phosphate dehydrogenase [bacterium]|nr:glycerol-3-phosphate dehydrogenase [bacterium]